MSCQPNGGALQLGCPSFPNTSPTAQPQWDVFAWNSFIAANWPALDPAANNEQRGFPNLNQRLANASNTSLLVWETFKENEREVFEEITKARSQVQAAAAGNDVPAKAAADAQLQGALVRLNAVAEAYPDLKANTNFLDLQKQLAETENQISFARQYYNDAVAKLNTLVRTIPWMFFTGIAGVHAREFYEAPAGSTEVPRVEF